jgi:hypothetical protein
MTLEQKSIAIAMYDGWAQTKNTEAQKYAKLGEVSLPHEMLSNKYMQLSTLQEVLSRKFVTLDTKNTAEVITLAETSTFFILPAVAGVIPGLIDAVYQLLCGKSNN